MGHDLFHRAAEHLVVRTVDKQLDEAEDRAADEFRSPHWWRQRLSERDGPDVVVGERVGHEECRVCGQGPESFREKVQFRSVFFAPTAVAMNSSDPVPNGSKQEGTQLPNQPSKQTRNQAS